MASFSFLFVCTVEHTHPPSAGACPPHAHNGHTAKRTPTTTARRNARVYTSYATDALHTFSVLIRADAAALARRRRERLLQLLDGLVGGLPALARRLEGVVRLLLALRGNLGLLLGEGGVALALLGLGGALLEQVRRQ